MTNSSLSSALEGKALLQPRPIVSLSDPDAVMLLTIGQIAARTGVAKSAIRYYESVGLLPTPPRQNGARRYTGETVRLLSTLKFAQRAGFSIADIRSLFHGFGEDTPPAARWRAIAEEKKQDLDRLIADAQRMRLALVNGMQCGCVRIEDCISDGDVGCGLTPIATRREAGGA